VLSYTYLHQFARRRIVFDYFDYAFYLIITNTLNKKLIVN
jgi:hypothetical protein